MKDHFELGCLNCVKRKTFTKECLLERDPKDCSDCKLLNENIKKIREEDLDKFIEILWTALSEFLTKKHITSASEVRKIITEIRENF